MTAPVIFLWAEVCSALFLAAQAVLHINHQNTKTWFLATLGWALLGAAAARVLVEAIDGVPHDPLRTWLLVQVALGVLFDRRQWDRRRRYKELRAQRRARDRQR